MKKRFRRGISLLTVMIMLTSMIPVGVIAEAASGENGVAVKSESLSVNSSRDLNVTESQITDQQKQEVTQDIVITEEIQTSATENGFEYVEVDGGISIIGYTGSGGDVVIPSYLGGKIVREIGKNAFQNQTSIINITMGNDIVSIGDGGFEYCTSLNTISLSNGLKTIGLEAFSDCSSLKSIVLPDSVTEIKEPFGSDVGAFFNCDSLKTAELGKGITLIPARMFMVCGNLENVTFHGNVSTIGSEAFWSCGSLKTVFLPDSLKIIEESAFGWCVSLDNIFIPNNTKKIGVGAFEGCEKLENLKLGDSLEEIKGGAFSNCKSLTEVILPSSLTNIESTYDMGVFSNCVNLSKVVIPDSIKTIGQGTFLNSTLVNIYGVSGSYAETYANTYDIPFIDSSVILLGDVDASGKVQAFDALMALQIATGKKVGTAQEIKAADVGNSAKVEAFDALRILQFATGKITAF